MFDEPVPISFIISTAPTMEVAEQLARQLVEERLIACANLVPGVASFFRWKGAVQSESEVLMLFKTQRARVEEFLDRLRELHPYEVPEALVVPLEAGLDAYSRWVVGETAEVSE